MENSLTRFVMQFEAAEEVTLDARKLSERDRDYFDERQLTAEEENTLKKRGQPVVIRNMIKRKVNAMLGLEKQTRKDPKAFPRNPDDEQSAKAATDALRYVCDNSRWDDLRSQCAKELAIEGTCAVKIGVTEGQEGIDPDIKRLPWDRFYYDPHSVQFDFSDAAYKGEVVWMDLDDALEKFPDAKDALESTVAQSSRSETYDDTPKWKLWADHKRRRVRLCEHYFKTKDGWEYCIFTKGGFVVEPMPSPYMGEKAPECPIHAVSLYVDRDGNRYGEVRTMIGAQDEVNKRSSKALHLITQRQVRVSPNTGMEATAIRKELSRPDGVFIGEPGDVEILPTSDMASGNIALLQEAKSELSLLGPNAALGGKNESDLSGRAIMAQQQGGMTELATYLDCIKTLSLATYRATWNRIRQYWDGPRWVRVTDDQRNLVFVGINQPITVLQAEAQKLGVDKANMAKADPQAVAYLETLATMPIAQQVSGIENAVAELDVDIIIDEGLDTPTVAAEQFDTLAKVMPALGPLAQSPAVLKALVQASSLRDKDALIEALEPKDGPQQPGPEEMMAAQMQAEQQAAQMEADIEMQKAQIKAQTDIEVAKIKAQTDLVIAGEKADIDAQIAVRKADTDAQLAERKAMLDYQVKSRVAEATGENERAKEAADKEDADKGAQLEVMQALIQTLSDMNRPKRKIPIRDENGFIVEMREAFEEAA